MISPAKFNDPRLFDLSTAAQRGDRRMILPKRWCRVAADRSLRATTPGGLVEPVAIAANADFPSAADIHGSTNNRISALGPARIDVSEAGTVTAIQKCAGQAAIDNPEIKGCLLAARQAYC